MLKTKLRPRRSAEKVLSFFAQKRIVATQSLPQGMRKEQETPFGKVFPLRLSLYDCVAFLLYHFFVVLSINYAQYKVK